MDDFLGAKGALFIGDQLLVTLRDDFDWIPWPGYWDFVGGEREPGETPRETLTRETREEVGLDLGAAEWLWDSLYPSMRLGRVISFHVLRLPAGTERAIHFGDEGQGWMLIPPERFLSMPKAVPSLQERLKVWLDGLGEAAPGT